MPRFIHHLACCGLYLLLAACAPEVVTQGHVKLYDSREKLQAGASTKQEVLKLMGSPTSVSSFGEERWYYISAKKQARAFLEPKVVEQNVLALTFDPEGTVMKIETYDLADAQKVAISKDATPTEGHSIGVVEQLVGNLGRFNKAQGQGRDAAATSRSTSRGRRGY